MRFCMYFLFTLLLLLGNAAADLSARQPNIIYILSDDLGHADVGFTNGNIETPNLNRLASEGVQLDQHYVQQVCTPTRGAFMSGRYPIHTGLQHDVIYPGEPWGLPTDETIIPQILQQYNYTNHAVGKWHLGMHKWSFTPLHRGFDDFFGYYLGAQNYLTHINSKGFDLRSNYFDKTGKLVDELRHDLDGRYSTELYSEYLQTLFQRLKTQENPFFVYMAFQNVHAPHMVPQHYIDRYALYISDPNQQIFAAMVSAMDEAIGNITKSLRENGLDDNTIIVFSSDNGGNVNCVRHVTSSNYPYRGGKRALYEGGIKSPSFIWAKNRLSPGRSSALIHVTDWLPTFWSLASLQGTLQPNQPIQTKPLDGVDQWRAIAENQPSNRTEFLINIDTKSIYCGHQVPHSGIRWKQWKLILGAGGPPNGWYPAPSLPWSRESKTCDEYAHTGIELYNVLEDPSETRNVSHHHPHIVKLLTKKLAHYKATAVPMGNKRRDPASNPKNFNNTWMPWMGEDEEVTDTQEYSLETDLWLSGNELNFEDLEGESCFQDDNWTIDF